MKPSAWSGNRFCCILFRKKIPMMLKFFGGGGGGDCLFNAHWLSFWLWALYQKWALCAVIPLWQRFIPTGAIHYNEHRLYTSTGLWQKGGLKQLASLIAANPINISNYIKILLRYNCTNIKILWSWIIYLKSLHAKLKNSKIYLHRHGLPKLRISNTIFTLNSQQFLINTIFTLSSCQF